VIDLSYIILYAVIAGIIVGSFLNVCIYRIPREISVNGNHGRSMCTECKKTLRWFDLIPVISYCILGGKCRFCKKHISLRYPVIELLNGILWGFAAYIWGKSWNTVLYCIFFSVLIIVCMIDWDTMEIPYRFEFIIFGLGVVSVLINGTGSILDQIVGIFAISVPMILITLLCGGFGGGDIQLMAVSGFLLGWKANIVAMLTAVIIAGIYGIVVIIHKKKRKLKIPFGPFLSFGLIFASIWGNKIFEWYIGLY